MIFVHVWNSSEVSELFRSIPICTGLSILTTWYDSGGSDLYRYHRCQSCDATRFSDITESLKHGIDCGGDKTCDISCDIYRYVNRILVLSWIWTIIYMHPYSHIYVLWEFVMVKITRNTTLIKNKLLISAFCYPH